MALIKCPECGKENVSDSAEMCPECGYGIKAHFEKIRQEEEKIEKEKRLEEVRKRNEIEAKKREEERIKNVPQPIKPVFNRGFIVYIVLAIIVLSWLFLYVPTTLRDMPDIGGWMLEIITFIGIPFLIYYSGFSKKVEKYNLAQSNFEEYQKQIVREQDEKIAAEIASAKERLIKDAQKPKCPYCHSHNTVKITTTAKAVNTAMFGLLGQKRKYQWHCRSYKSDF